jgi:hypothetical protein
MRWLRWEYLGIILFILVFSVFGLPGCVSGKTKLVKFEAPPPQVIELLDNLSGLGRCGVLHVKRPLFNITGFLTAAARPNSSIHLFVVPDTTFGSALYVVQHCPSLFKEPIYSEKYFRFDYLPAGNYVAMVPRSAFYQFQGFPIINEFNLSNHSARVNFHGGDYRYSLGSFSIFPVAEGPKTEK